MAAEQGSGAALNPALTQVLEYDTYNMGRSGSILADVWFERSLAALAVVVGGQVGGILYLLHFLSVPSSHGAESCSDDGRTDADEGKSDDNDDTCSHSGLSEEEEEGKRLEEISEVRKEMAPICSLYILEYVWLPVKR